MSRGMIQINAEQCKGCTLCTTVCPQGVIAMSAETLNARGYRPAVLADAEGRCTGCAVCALICPDACITVYRQPVQREALTEVQA